MSDDKYRFTADMAEISGLGGDYEECCREALRGALLYLDANPGAALVVEEIDGLLGLVKGNARLESALAAGDAVAFDRFGLLFTAPGSMALAIANCLLFIQKNGWDAFCVQMLKDGGAA